MRELSRRFFGRMEAALAAVVIVIAATFSLASPYFLTASNLVDLVETQSVTLILAAGVFVVLVSGGIDVSFTAIAAVSQYAGAYLATRHGFSALPAVAAACAAGAVLGGINAVLCYSLRVVSIIVTIATAGIYQALLIHVTDGKELYDLPDWWTERVVFLRVALTSDESLRVTLPVVVMLVVVSATHLLMTRTGVGRQIYALGGNPEAAARIGIRVLGVQVFVYGYLGTLAGIAGVLQAHRMGQVVPTAWVGTELNVLAIAILGGASLSGGVGTMGGVMLGVLLLAIVQNGLNLLGVSSYFFQVVTGAAILAAISLTARAGRWLGPRSLTQAAR